MNDSILLIQSQNIKSTAMGTSFVVHSDEGFAKKIFMLINNLIKT